MGGTARLDARTGERGTVEFRLLGPVEVRTAGDRVPLTAAKPAALLAAGLVRMGRPVPVDQLVEALWSGDPPATAHKLVQSYVAALRRALHGAGRPEIVATHPAGYVVTVPADLPATQRDAVRASAERIYRALGCEGLARVDQFLCADGRLVLNEVNTLPGFTAYSRYPRMMAAAGLSLADVIDRAVALALAR